MLLQLGYNKCPMLCNLVLNGAFDGLQGVDWLPGKEFQVVSISVDPTETAALAKAKKESYLAEFNRAAARRRCGGVGRGKQPETSRARTRHSRQFAPGRPAPP